MTLSDNYVCASLTQCVLFSKSSCTPVSEINVYKVARLKIDNSINRTASSDQCRHNGMVKPPTDVRTVIFRPFNVYIFVA